MTSVSTIFKVTAAYSPQSNVRAERMIQTLKGAVKRMLVDTQADWGELLPLIVNSISARQAKDGYSPYELMFGVSRLRMMTPHVTVPQLNIEVVNIAGSAEERNA